MSMLTAIEVENYTARLNMLSQASRRAVARLLGSIEYDDVADLREKLIELLEPFLAASTDNAAAYAAEFYDSVREQAIGSAFGAEALPMRSPAATEQAIRAIVQRVVDGATLEEITDQLLERIDFEIKRASGECVMENSKRDPQCIGYARVPTGSETCGFCLMLASRGFVYRSGKLAGSEGHYHANCDCRIVPGFTGMEVQGYDPDGLYDRWKESEHAEYMKRRAESGGVKRKRASSYQFKGGDGLPEFKSFADVKEYIYSAADQKELEHRFSVLGRIFGFGSSQMRSQSLKNAVKHRQKQL